MMLPEDLYKSIEETMRQDPFPFENITTFAVIACMTFQEGYTDACKNNAEKNKFISELIKLTKHLVREGLISEKLYGWKDVYREKLK